MQEGKNPPMSKTGTERGRKPHNHNPQLHKKGRLSIHQTNKRKMSPISLILRVLLLLVSASQVCSQKMDAKTTTTTTTTTEEDYVGLLVLLNNGELTTDGSSCPLEDFNRISAKLFNSITDDRRALRDDQANRKLPGCGTLCQAFPPGQCKCAYPWCDNRRDLKEDQKQLTAPTLRGRSLETLSISSISTLSHESWELWDESHPTEHEICLERKTKIEQALAELLNSDGLKPCCHLMLTHNITIGCVRMDKI